jgi:hypothetical protein
MQEAQDREYNTNTAGPVAKLWYIVVWIGRSPQWEKLFYLKGAFSEKLEEPARRDQPVG